MLYNGDMLSLDSLMKAHEDGVVTQCELFAHLVAILSPDNLDEVRKVLGRELPRLAAFDTWLASLAHGGAVYLGSVPVSLTVGAKLAILRCLNLEQ